MKRLVLTAALMLLCAGYFSAGAAAPPKAKVVQTFVGEISDSQCAMNVHSLTRSHEEMLKRHTTGTDAASCTRYCVRELGGDYVLTEKTKVYHLADGSKAAPFAGQKVQIKGTLNGDTIQIAEIAKAR